MSTLRASYGVCCGMDLFLATEEFKRWPNCVYVGLLFWEDEGNDKWHGSFVLDSLTEACVHRL